ncbi:hypothetical protein [Tautonia rosea]|uniref:hypothetical protein n=1 Tax=Tautonia rosea TaxID=2728037 RepID=UPI00147427E6|nr:hypothetical protein [Tautonia rosea]
MASDPTAKDQRQPSQQIESVKIFSYPKVIFLWPTMVFALICGTGMLIVGDLETTPEPPVTPEAVEVVQAAEEGQGEGAQVAEGQVEAEQVAEIEVPPPGARRFSSWQNIFGAVFLIVFAVNMMVMSLDFPRFTLIAVILFALTLTFLLLYLASQGVDFLSPLTALSRHLYFAANAGFFFAIAFIQAVMYAIIWATRYLDYWEIRPNEVLHHHGPLSDLDRYPTIQLKFSKEIPDILEFLLGLGAGRLVLNFSTNDRVVTLDHVLFINSKEDQLKRLMSQLQVRIPGQEV